MVNIKQTQIAKKAPATARLNDTFYKPIPFDNCDSVNKPAGTKRLQEPTRIKRPQQAITTHGAGIKAPTVSKKKQLAAPTDVSGAAGTRTMFGAPSKKKLGIKMEPTGAAGIVRAQGNEQTSSENLQYVLKVSANKIVRKQVNEVTDIAGATPKKLNWLRRENSDNVLVKHYLNGVDGSVSRKKNKMRNQGTYMNKENVPPPNNEGIKTNFGVKVVRVNLGDATGNMGDMGQQKQPILGRDKGFIEGAQPKTLHRKRNTQTDMSLTVQGIEGATSKKFQKGKAATDQTIQFNVSAGVTDALAVGASQNYAAKQNTLFKKAPENATPFYTARDTSQQQSKTHYSSNGMAGVLSINIPENNFGQSRNIQTRRTPQNTTPFYTQRCTPTQNLNKTFQSSGVAGSLFHGN